MAYTETTQTSWGSRLGGAFKGMVTGIVLVVVGTILLYWNEGRTVKTGGAINEARSVAVKVDDISRVDPALAGKVIYATGRADTRDVLTDPIFGASATAIDISRRVEYYQWQEHSRQETRKKLGGGEETVTTYTYTREWVGGPIDSGSFKDPEYQGRNKVLASYEDETLYAPNVTFGGYTLPDFLKRSIGGAVPLDLVLDEDRKKAIFEGLSVEPGPVGNAALPAVSSSDPASLDAALMGGVSGVVPPQDRYVHAQGNVLYLGEKPGSPQVGDIRVTFTQTPPADVSIIAQVAGNTFEEFTATNGYTFSRLSMGTVGMERMFAGAESDNAIMAWILRVVGTIVVIAGLGTILHPLSVIADVIPILGSIVGVGTGLVAFLLGLAWSLLVIAVAWIRFRPVLAASLLGGVVVLVGLLFVKGRKGKAA
ncbi:TMEM43 family protein [uncultured Fretibacterium sp.]|uniref:TMEM43 family protein n=1 Tax=uncultured Fretibacterium sp. TaxID=1678694 RepID=UPI00261B5F11|nr:TMEM43 family protein [uncultured Fretibacterium sp.]